MERSNAGRPWADARGGQCRGLPREERDEFVRSVCIFAMARWSAAMLAVLELLGFMLVAAIDLKVHLWFSLPVTVTLVCILGHDTECL